MANFWVIRRLGTRAVAKVTNGESIPSALTWVGALVLKMTVLFGLVWLLVRRVGLPVLPFTLGLSVFVVSILITGLFLGGAGAKLAPPPPIHDPPPHLRLTKVDRTWELTTPGSNSCPATPT